MIARDPRDRFVEKIIVAESCWEFDGHHLWNGYGYFFVPEPRRRLLSHRFSYEMFVGPIPVGLHIDHLCKNRGCIRPSHLEAVTQAENNRRSDAPNMIAHRAGVCKLGHPLTYRTLRTTGRRRGSCQVCNTEWQRAKAKSLRMSA